MPNKLIGFTMRIGGAILCVILLNKFPVGDIHGCNCAMPFLLHIGVCIFATITDYFDDYDYPYDFIEILLRILSVVIGLILCIISMALGHLICAGGMFLISLLFVCISVFVDLN